MKKETAADLVAFLVVAREQSFTRAAAQLRVSQSALSQTMRGLESRLGVRLLTRTTRRVSVTEAGERLLRAVGPRFEEIDDELEAVTSLREKPAGTIRLTATENAAASILWPVLERFLPKYPEIKVEIVIDYGLTDIVAQRFDAGVRPGETVASGMISVRIAPDMRMAVVGAPAYFAERKPPKAPQDLTDHQCINLRLPTRGGIYAWEFEKNGREMNVRVDGQLILGTATFMLMARSRRVRPGLPSRGRRCAATLKAAASSARLPTGARHFLDTIFTIPAAASRLRLLRYWSKRCATAHPRRRLKAFLTIQ